MEAHEFSLIKSHIAGKPRASTLPVFERLYDK
jgi:hypothetical protein